MIDPPGVEMVGLTERSIKEARAMSLKNRILATVGGAGLTLAIAVTAVTAGGPVGGSAAPMASASPSPISSPATATGPATTSAGISLGDFGNVAFAGSAGFAAAMPDPAQCEDVQGKLAANLGVTTDQLEAAIKKTLLQEIDEALADGKLTAEQAQTARARVNSATDLCAGFGAHIAGRGDRGGANGPAIAGGGQIVDSGTYQAVATYFGISTDQLQQDLKDNGSLQAVAAKYGKDTAAGKAALQATILAALKDDLTKRGVPQAMIDRVVAEFTANFDTFYTSKLGQGLPGGIGGPGKRQGPRVMPSPSPTTQTQ